MSNGRCWIHGGKSTVTRRENKKDYPKISPTIGLTVAVPAYNEAESLAEFHRRLSSVMASLDLPYEVVYVNDGSADNTLDILITLQSQDCHISIVNLSRNFGKEIAITAALDHARGEGVVVLDADLQDPPELIPELVTRWQEGFDVVYARRLRRDGETLPKKLFATLFYRLMQYVGSPVIPKDTGDFRLMSRRAVDAVCQLRETHRFMKGLFAWIGYPQTEVSYARDPRFAGASKWGYWKLVNLAIEGLTSFTVAPLRMASLVGLMTSLASFAFAVWIITRVLVFGIDVPGYASMMTVVLFLGGMQLLCLGIVGEYLGRTFNEVKRRPLYFVVEYRPADGIAQPGYLSRITRTAVPNP